jgi:uncharacterized protein YwqG
MKIIRNTNPSILIFNLSEFEESCGRLDMKIPDKIYNCPFYLFDKSFEEKDLKFVNEEPINKAETSIGFKIVNKVWSEYVSKSSDLAIDTLFIRKNETDEEYDIQPMVGFVPGYDMKAAEEEAKKQNFNVLRWKEFWTKPIPPFLNKYKTQISEQQLETVTLKAHPVSSEQKLPIKQSKFLGEPYFPLHTDYPKCEDGTPMILLAQINFTELPKLQDYPDKGIVQFFIPSKSWHTKNEYKIMFHPNDEEEYRTDFSFLTDKLYAYSPIHCEHSLTFQKETEYCGYKDFRFNIDFDGLDYDDFFMKLEEEQQAQMRELFEAEGHKVGGYAYFTQEDPRGYGSQFKDDVLLLQIDSDTKIRFGDNGVASILINRTDLKNKKFENAYFHWDCF